MASAVVVSTRKQFTRPVVLGALAAGTRLLLAAGKIGAQFGLQPLGTLLSRGFSYRLFSLPVSHCCGIAQTSNPENQIHPRSFLHRTEI